MGDNAGNNSFQWKLRRHGETIRNYEDKDKPKLNTFFLEMFVGLDWVVGSEYY